MSEEQVSKLIVKRDAIKSKLSIFSKFVLALENKYPDKLITDTETLLDLETRLESAQKYIDLFDDLQLQIEELDNSDKQLTAREDFEGSYYSIIAKAKTLYISNTVKIENESHRGNSPVPCLNSSELKCVKLPVIDLPKFDGDSNQWLGFRDTFHSLIHSRDDISDIQKFHYLKSSVGPKLRETFENLEFSSANYQDAWKSLCERFNDINLLVDTHLKAIYGLEKITHESSTSIRILLDIISNRLKALKNLGEPTEHWGNIIKFLVLVKLNEATIDKWDEYKTVFERPTLDNLLEFLKMRANNLQSKENSRHFTDNIKPKLESKSKYKTLISFNNTNKYSCKLCKGEHNTMECPELARLGVAERLEQVKKRGLCINCLKTGHMVKDCRSGSCRTCKGRHHTLLHINRNENNIPQEPSVNPNTNNTEAIALASQNTSSFGRVLLSTVMVRILDRFNKPHLVRGLLDVGSQTSFISTELAKSLRIDLTPTQLSIGGLNGAHSEAKHKCTVTIHSTTNSYSINLNCLVVPNITGILPNFQIDKGNLKIPCNIQLADPKFDIPNKVDILIGSDCFYDILCTGQIKLSEFGPILQKTKFGWVIGGPIQSALPQTLQCNLSKCDNSLEQAVARFWEIEEFPDVKPWSTEEKLVEAHFQENTKRDELGRFIVTIPLNANLDVLGSTSEIAKKRFFGLERKFKSNPEFAEMYRQFMDEYKRLGHMVKINNPNAATHSYYMPHHGVLKESSTSTKLRVVFDSSCPSDTGYSFNDLQMVGPTIQSDLFSILVLHRKHNFVIAADIEKMYRMCRINPSQQPLQRIFWRNNPEEDLETYELTTVTYGTSAAAFLAIRCLYQLGLECEDPIISDVIKTQFYVDDMLSGSSTVEGAIYIANKVSDVLKSGGFHLCKFISNSSEILCNIESRKDSNLDLGANENTRTLGMIWNASIDCFLYNISFSYNRRITKRVVLSEISQIFDPLGLLSPTLILAKIILRDIWSEKIGWDDSLPLNLHTNWLEFRNELINLNKLRISRQIVCFEPTRIELHAFSDASTKAYGTCIYLKSTNSKNESFIHLITAKSKVSPIKLQTVPRLELMAALLMSKLVDKVISALKMHIDEFFYWTDSTIVLGWINTPPNQLQVFVANRVASIQHLTKIDSWRHVPTNDNPADYVSRGVPPTHLETTHIYWNGPIWLRNQRDHWPPTTYNKETLPELRTIRVHKATVEIPNLFEKYSDLSKLERVTAYCLRFISNCRTKGNERNLGPLTTGEINLGINQLIKISQSESFEIEIELLKGKLPLQGNSKLLKLHPFLDNDGILRVGGRLAYSSFSLNKRFPIVLCSKNRFTQLLFAREHKRLLHAGPALLLGHIRNKFWPLGGRNLARKIFRDCVICFKARPIGIAPIMGNLPPDRIEPAPPFYKTGVDYAGPFRVKDRQGRGCKVTKAYVCLFICFVTHAIHIELVSDLSSECFIAAFRRFISRRGKPFKVFSDNGTNFVGAKSEIDNLGRFIDKNSVNLVENFENMGVSWSFIPPHSPHFGGLWEAGIKSAKFHLVRVAGNALLTFEQFYTLLVQIEGILNTRPLHPLSSEPSDFTPLTPAHFLIGRPITSLPEPNLLEVCKNRLKTFQRVQQLQQHFWKRWSLEYVSELQQRVKWSTNKDQLNKNDLVLVKDDNLPPFRWNLGRIVDVHRGHDGVARVATIRTKAGNIKRSFSKLCPLPVGHKDVESDS